MPSPFKHNKKRNSGLVYEFLVRQLAMSVVDKDALSYNKTVEVVKKYFSSTQPLAREKEIFDVIVASRGLTRPAATKMLDEVKKYVSLLDGRKIEIKKSNLIKDIHHTFGQGFFTVYRIPEYRLYASIQMLIEQYKAAGNVISESAKTIQLEESLVSYMTSRQDNRRHTQAGEKIDSLVAAIAVKKFAQRYSSMNENQKRTLMRFVNYSMTDNRERFCREMNEDRTSILLSLESAKGMQCFKDDSVMRSRFEEASERLKKMSDVTTDESVKDMLLYHKLVEEIGSDE